MHDETRSVTDLAGTRAVGPGAGTASDDLETGARLGRYVVLGRVGSGGMGEVLAAYDPELDRKVALKVVKQDAVDDEATTLLRAEAQTLARLAHPNIVAVHDVGWHEGRLFLAMEFVDGRSLADWLREERRLWREVVDVFLAAGQGLAAAHRAGFLHQDFTLRNVLVGRDGAVRVADFGLAVAVGPAATGGSQGSGPATLRGTPAYVAPERRKGARPDTRSDQFSFCVALHRALFGEVPTGGSLEKQPGAGPAKAAAGVPRWLERVVARGLDADPGRRYASMDELLETLSWRRRTRLRRRWAAAAAGVAAAAALAPIWLPKNPCRASGPLLDGVWDEAARGRLREAFAASPAEAARVSAEVVVATLDDYASGWVAMRDETCRSTYVEGVQSPRVHDLRALCLDSRREALGAFVDLHAGGDPALLLRAPETVLGLPPLAECADEAGLAFLAVRDLDPEERRQVGEIQRRAEDAASRQWARQPVDVPALEADLAAARELDYPPLEARILVVLARIATDEAPGKAAGVQRAALAATMRGGDRVGEAVALARLASFEARHGGRLAVAAEWQELAEAAFAALGDGHGWARVDALGALAVSSHMLGRFDETRDYARRRVALSEELWGRTDPRYAQALNTLGSAIGGQDPAESLALVTRTAEILAAQWGPTHPLLAEPYFSVAIGHTYAGDYPTALDWVDRAAQALRQGPTPDVSRPAVHRSQILAAMDRPAEAAAALVSIAEQVSSVYGELHPFMAIVHLGVADAAVLELRLLEAGEALARAGRVLAGVPPEHPLQAQDAVLRARLSLLRGEPATALAALAPYTTSLESHAEELRWVALGRLLLGEAHRALGHPEDARRELERGLALCRPDAEAVVAPEIRFRLALLAAAAGDRAGASAQAREALGSLPAGGSPLTQKLREEMEGFLAAPGSAQPPPFPSSSIMARR